MNVTPVRPGRGKSIIGPIHMMTLKASTLSNRGCEVPPESARTDNTTQKESPNTQMEHNFQCEYITMILSSRNRKKLCVFYCSDVSNQFLFVYLYRSSEHRHIKTTKRYARLAGGNVGNFQMNCKDGISVHAYSVGWLLPLSSRLFLRPPSEDVVYQCHASIIKMLLWWLESN